MKEYIVKKTNCLVCGAPKRIPSDYAYVYCDYCGSYTDFDITHVTNAVQKLQEPDYLAQWQSIYQKKQKALSSQNEGQLYKLEIQSYSLLVNACPGMWPVRIGDSSYRKDLIEFSARYAVFSQLDEQVVKLFTKAGDVMGDMKFVEQDGKRLYSDNGSWKYYLAWYEYVTTGLLMWERSGFNMQHPDNTDPRIALKSTVSGFLQGLLAVIPDRTYKKILEHSGLVTQYIPTEFKDACKNTCGRCGAPMISFAGSTNKVCEYCGFMVDLKIRDFNCPGCGINLCLPVTEENLRCPSCSTGFKTNYKPKINTTYSGNVEDVLSGMLEELEKIKR